MAKTSTTNNTDTTGTTPQATAQEDPLVLVRVTALTDVPALPPE